MRNELDGCGNTHALRQHENQMEANELAYEAYQLEASDSADGILQDLLPLIEILEVLQNHKEIFDKYSVDFEDDLKGDIYGMFEEIQEAFSSDCYDVMEEVKDFMGISTYNACSECGY